MPTFASRTSDTRLPPPSRSRCHRGFTLLEVLVVVVIVGILTGTVILGFTGADMEQELKGAAQRLAVRVELARQHALQRNREWGIYVRDESYAFAELDPETGSWIEHQGRPFDQDDLPDAVRLRVATEGVGELPFADADYYWAAGALDGGDIIVYTYNAHHKRENQTAEQNIPYVISTDGGRTWSEVKTAHFAKGIRNMQLSEKLGELYFMHGRSGSYSRDLVDDDPGPNNFVLYSSRDGIHWDEGILLMSRLQTPGGGDCYSANEIIGKHDPATPEKLLIHADVSYSGAKTNMHQWWVTTAP